MGAWRRTLASPGDRPARLGNHQRGEIRMLVPLRTGHPTTVTPNRRSGAAGLRSRQPPGGPSRYATNMLDAGNRHPLWQLVTCAPASTCDRWRLPACPGLPGRPEEGHHAPPVVILAAVRLAGRWLGASLRPATCSPLRAARAIGRPLLPVQ